MSSVSPFFRKNVNPARYDGGGSRQRIVVAGTSSTSNAPRDAACSVASRSDTRSWYEEHRFGVRQKEQLKRLRAEVDVLTLTATPIPRTLAMAMEGLRDFSVIATGAAEAAVDQDLRRAVFRGRDPRGALRELKRGGPGLLPAQRDRHHREHAREARELLPEARIRIGHGQMPERELEQVMRDFYQQRCNVLLCSTIIETGHRRADGEHDHHQSRRHVRPRAAAPASRARRPLASPGVCVPADARPDALTPNAQKRLEAIQNLEDLGSGFFLAMHDLEIRGAGEVLGESQSGEMQEVGFQLYTDMLSRRSTR
jgi:transcription-repair coupling factor (superfamily II helicase)